MQENNLKGLWIPYEILTSKDLSDKEKYIYSIILFFSKNTGYCAISNKYLGMLINLSDTRVSKLVSSLSNKQYIQVITHFKDETKQVISRKIIPLVKYDYSKTTSAVANNDYMNSQESSTDIVENDKYKNSKIFNKYNNSKPKQKKNIVQYEQRDFTGFDFSKLYAN